MINMKKIIAWLLLIVMVIGMASCGATTPDDDAPTGSESSGGTGSTNTGGSGSSGTEGGTGSGTGSSTGSGTGSSGGSTNTKPTYRPEDDTLVYEAITNSDGTLKYLDEILLKPAFTPYYNGYKAALSMTFDDGDHYETGYNVSEIFAQYGFTGTAMLTAGFINDSTIIDNWNIIFDKGYLDAGCHGYDHADPRSLSESGYEHEIKEAIEFLRMNFPSQRVLTYASPLAQPSTPYEEYLANFVIANRLEAMGERAYLGKEFNAYRIQAVSVNARVSPPSQSFLEENINAGTWIVELYHQVRKDGASGINCDYNTLASHCKTLYEKYSDVLWVASFEKVAIYSKQIQNTFVEYIDATSNSMTLKAGCTIADDVYNIPMSIEVNVPSFVDSAIAELGDEVQYLEVVTRANKKYVTVKNIKAEGEEFKIILGGNVNCLNKCNHVYIVKEHVEATCEEIGYDINECVNCTRTYVAKFTAPYGHSYMGNPDEHVCATTTSEGYEKYKCRFCDYIKTVILPKT